MIDSRSKATVGSEANIPGKHRHYFDSTCPTSVAQELKMKQCCRLISVSTIHGARITVSFLKEINEYS